MHATCRWGIGFVGLLCVLFLGGCNHDAQKWWSASVSISYNLLDGKEREHEIVQGDNSLETIGITDDECPIVTAEFGKLLPRWYLEVYLNPKAVLKGSLFRSQMTNDVWTQTSFTDWKGWTWERTWKVVYGEAPQKEEWWWEGTYRTDGETIYFDATNKNGSPCTWMLTTPAPKKSREK